MSNITENKVSLGKDKIKFLLLEGASKCIGYLKSRRLYQY